VKPDARPPAAGTVAADGRSPGAPGWLLAAGAGFAALAVALGAFGAHGLADHLSPERLQTWETAVRYQMYHALALLLLVSLPGRFCPGGCLWIARLLIAGVVLFSGSLYALVLLDLPLLGMVTPFGGLAWIVAWCGLAWRGWLCRV